MTFEKADNPARPVNKPAGFSPAPATDVLPASGATRPTHIVGVGASAGGLEALESFFDNMRPDSGLAFVVIQHLSPDFRSLMDELLSRHTQIAIHRVEDGMLVEPNSIYLIPPKKEMIVSAGRLLLTDKDPAQGLALPIDVFFRSLAQDVGNRAIGVILSGTGSDGSRGIRAIYEAGGLVIAQREDSAKFDGMPRSAIETGAVDYVLPPSEMPGAILEHASHPDQRDAQGRPIAKPHIEKGMDAIFRILREEYGIDFSYYKPNTVTRRVERRLDLNRSHDLEDYISRLRDDPTELNSLYRDLLIGVTKFFRDQAAFDRLESEVIPPLLMKVRPDGELRAWVAGCATGEEAYSLAILIHERLATLRKPVNVKIFATDVHRASLEFASAGIYSEAALSEVSPKRLERYFSRQGSGYQVSQDLRKMIVFAPHNVIKDAPFTKLDMITCRNLLIYLQAPAQNKALSLFHFGLKAGGVLVLGPSETPGELNDEFEIVDHHWKIFRKRRDSRLPADIRLPLGSGYPHLRSESAKYPARHAGLPDMQLMRAYDALLDQYVPPSLLVNERRELVHSFSGAGSYLVPRDGRPSADILDMVQGDLKLALTGALQRAAKEQTSVAYSGIAVRTVEGEHEIKLAVKPLNGREPAGAFTLITLERMAPREEPVPDVDRLDMGDVSRERVRSLEDELRYTKENLQATVEEMETSNEELQATNEELVASNEELQSTNEELHSVNEELYTVNAEYQRKIHELTELNNDMDNLFRSIDAGMIFLDHDLRIRKFNPRIADAFHILPQDVGRTIDSFSHNLRFDGLLDAVVEVLNSQERFEQQIQDRQGNWFLLRILPYRAKSNADGVVISVIDIAALKETEKRLQLMSKVFMDAADPIVIEDLDGRIAGLNPAAEEAYGWKHEELLGREVKVLIPPELHDLADELRARCREAEDIRNEEGKRVTKSGQVQSVLLTLSLITGEEDEPMAIASIAKDISRLKEAEQEAQEEVRRRDLFLATLSHELRNPLGAILNATRVMEREPLAEESVRAARDVVRRQSRQMACLLDDLLDVSRVTQGKIEIRQDVFDLRRTLEDAVQAVRPLVEAREQQLAVMVADNSLCVRGDASRLQQIQVNLLNNASKYTPTGGRIELRVEREENEVVIRVRDSGEGIPPEMLPRVFEMFVQSDASLARSDGGMGVGLTLVRMLVEMHGGTVAAHSDGPGKGSEFVVRLPYCNEPEDVLPEPPSRHGAANARKVLIVEDNDDSRQMLQAILELDGHDVTVCSDGLQGLEALTRQRFDIALVDIGLPGIDGYQLARRVREQRQDLCLVALTGYGRKSDHAAVLDAGFDEHLVKPLNPVDLDRILRQPASSSHENQR